MTTYAKPAPYAKPERYDGSDVVPPVTVAPTNLGGTHLAYINDARLTIGVCRYPTNFTPPSGTFPNH